MSLKRPNPFIFTWAENGEKWTGQNLLPEQWDEAELGVKPAGRADIEIGFPKETMISVLQGGVPPYGRDHNAILNHITTDLQWAQAGGLPTFNEGLRDKFGGYPLGVELQSANPDRPYVSYINMVEGNKNNPDDYVSADDYWRNDDMKKKDGSDDEYIYINRGNGWAIKTILSDDSDNISYLDDQFRIVTKVAGAKSDVYVRLKPPSLNPDGSQDHPFTSVQDAINAIPDGGSGSIHMWQPDTFSLDTWNIGRRNIKFYPWFGDDTINDLQITLASKIFFFSVYLMKNYPRVQVNINIRKGLIIPNTYDPDNISGNGKVEFYGFNFVATQKLPEGYSLNGASPFQPEMTYQFIGCIFTNVDYLDFWFNGWQNSITYDIKFDHCLINADQAFFIQIGNGTVNINASSDEDWTFSQGLTDMKIGYLEGNNSHKFLQRTSNYSNFHMKVIGYSDEKGNGPIYYPNGLNTNFDLVFS